jgi:DNA repair protein RecN (Recombination protein N)
MLRELAVQNLALIEDVRVELQTGFCAWTGETGAGKSLLLGALGMLLGERGSTDLMRTGAEELRITGRFEVTRPELRRAIEMELGNPLDDDTIILARRLARSGRSAAYINDEPVTVAKLRAVGGILVDIHGQRENHSLLQPAYQLELLDAFGKLATPRQNYQTGAEKLRELRKRFHGLKEKQQLRQRELSLLQFERAELEQAALVPNEANDLTRERDRLVNAQALQEFTARGAQELYDEEGSIVEQLGRLLKEAQDWVDLDPKLAEVAARLENLVPEVQDLAETFRDLGDRFEADPQRLDEIEKRLTLIRRLESKYHRNADAIIDYQQTLETQAAELQQQEDDLTGLQAEIKTTFAQVRDTASVLSKGRAKVAKKLASEAQKHLADLGMPDARLEATLDPLALGDDPFTGDVPLAGLDVLEFMLQANKGEPPRPLRKVASGGELARTMLALKTVLSAHDPVGTMIFDELDANVGGRLGDVLGQKLAALGRSHQVICVTHLPQVASYAKHQWTIRKQTRGQRTSTTITPLANEPERIEELASMLRGSSRGETTRQEVVEMLKAAKAVW